MDKLHEIYETTSEPTDKRYGQWLNTKQLVDIIAPPQAHIETVVAWLKTHDVSAFDLDVQKDMIHIEVTLEQAQAILGQKVVYYEQKKTGLQLAKAIGPIFVPQQIAAVVDTIVGIGSFPIYHQAFFSDRKPDSPDLITVTPKVLIERYNVSTVEKLNSKNRQAVAEFQGQYISQSDVTLFYKDFGLNGTGKIAKYIGQNNPAEPGIESSLDVDYIDGLSDTTPLDYYIYPGMDFCSDLISWTGGIANTAEPGLVHSVSYGAQYHNPICDKTTRDRLDANFKSLNTKGLTFVIASGDSGSGQYSRAGYNDGYLVPSWPASSEYCTAVGSTYFYEGNENVESATTQFGSGGGFSYEHTRPTWQDAAVKSYLASTKLPTAKYAQNGRGTPDVSAMGEEFTIVMRGNKFPGVGGTSASTPTFAGIVSRLNDLRLNAGKSSLGQINKLIYSNPQMFYDVTIGSDKIGMNKQGWDCAKGWDPVTGMGTPNFVEMAKVLASLP
eukprot:TRINITY_DN24672_c0_g1_i1.p1 TRINITY_DN24672_c0_g1~~TRINITY_DN24672_c0_g1_i1.p1  ORF type:complete len:560 (-),score=75.16 TRINITY_DN24672_c0_g1_i1:59-1549(-)